MSISRSTSSQQHRVQRFAATTDANRFFSRFNAPDLLETLEKLTPNYRERIYTPGETLSMFMTQALKADRSCQGIVNDAAVIRWRQGMEPCSTNTGGYCSARQRLPIEMVSGLLEATGQVISKTVPQRGLWNGHRVRVVDGTTVTLPDTAANQAGYPQMTNQKPGLGFPICRIVVAICLSSGAIMNAAIGKYQGKKTGETALFRSMLDTFDKGDVILADALYATYFMLLELQSRGMEALFEQHGARKRSTDFLKGEKLGCKDHLITLPKPKVRPDWMTEDAYASAPATLTVRELSVGGKVLVTTLFCPRAAPKAALKALYKRRWNVELDIRNIKTTLGMETLTCQTPEMAKKEVFVYLLAYNVIRLMMNESALLADVVSRSLSFKHTLQLWLAWSAIPGQSEKTEIDKDILRLVAEQTVGNRAGRIEPRAIKRRPKPYPILMQARTAARKQVEKFGHPKKIR